MRLFRLIFFPQLEAFRSCCTAARTGGRSTFYVPPRPPHRFPKHKNYEGNDSGAWCEIDRATGFEGEKGSSV